MKKTLLTLAAFIAGTMAWAQVAIPNGSFENWTGNPPIPDNWEVLTGKITQYTSTAPKTTSITINGTPTTFTFTPTQGTKCIDVQSDTNGVGITSPFWGQVRNMFPFTSRPNGAQLYFAYLSKASVETFGITFTLFKSTAGVRDTVFNQLSFINQGGVLINPGSTSNPWLVVNFGFNAANYRNTNTPDSMSVVISSSATTQKTVDAELLVDNLTINSFGTGSPVVMPVDFETMSAYPNPSSGAATIKYQVPQNSQVNMSVYDITGKKISTLVDEYKEQGKYTASFDGSNLKPGVYFCSLEAGDYKETRKLTVVH